MTETILPQNTESISADEPQKKGDFTEEFRTAYVSLYMTQPEEDGKYSASELSKTERAKITTRMSVLRKEAQKAELISKAEKFKGAVDASRAGASVINAQSDHSQPLELEHFPHPVWSKDKETGMPFAASVKCHEANLKYMLDCYGITVRYNVISKQEDIIIPSAKGMLADNEDAAKLEYVSSLCALNMFPITRLQQQLTSIANANPFNPVIEYAESKAWDGVDRIELVCNTISTKPEVEEWRDVAITKALFSAIAAAMNNQEFKFSFKGSLVLQGGQGMGKTPWIRLLAGDLTKYFKEGHELNPGNKDSVIQAVEHWMVELGELDATTKKADVAALKAFLTMYRDEYRRPFAPKNTRSPRRTVFFGSVNPQEFLVDTTGNDRFWVVPVMGIDLDTHESIDKQQLWAQVLFEVKSGLERGVKLWMLTDLERDVMRDINNNYRALTPIEEKLADVFGAVLERPKAWHGSTTKIAALIGYDKFSAKDRAIAKQWLTTQFGEERKSMGITGFSIPHPTGYSDEQMRYEGFYQFKY